MGYHRAWPDAEIVGVDLHPQPRYPFTFVQGDAIAYAEALGDTFDFIHASPPCQHFTMYRNNVKDITERYENLLEPTRALLAGSGIPYAIENVPGAPLLAPTTLCGSMFGLDVRRHRLFETSWFMLQPSCNHGVWTERKYKGSTNRGPRFTIEVGAWDEPIALQRAAMGIDWMQLRELSESIPPAYTEHIGRALSGLLAGQAVAA